MSDIQILILIVFSPIAAGLAYLVGYVIGEERGYRTGYNDCNFNKQTG